jgi:hypothetical protein
VAGDLYDRAVARLRPAGSIAWRQVTRGSRPVFLAGIALALLTWPSGISYPGAGLDFSWIGGLYMAATEGKHFGTEVIFTYGPLGFLDWPQLWYGALAVLGFLYFCVMYISFVTTLTWSLNRTLGLLGAVVVVFLAAVAVNFLGELPMLLAVGLCYAALREDRPVAAVNLLVIGGGVLCAIEPLIKLSVGPSAALIVILGMIGARASRRQWAGFVAIAVGGFFTAWFVTGQGFGNLWDYAANGYQIIVGYNEAMGFDGAETWEAVAIIVFALGLIAIIHRACFRDRLAKVMATLLTAVAVYVVYKYGTTQFGKGGPPVVALATMVTIFMLAPWPRRRAGAFLVTTALASVVVLHAFPATASLDVITKMETFKSAVGLAVHSERRHGVISGSRATLQTALEVPTEVLEAIKGKTVAVEPWETAAVWAYELDWKPLPVFQNYSAYTSELDRLNAEAIEDPENGPQVLLRQVPSGIVPGAGRPAFVERQPLWDPPEQNLADVCNFVPTLTAEKWQVLSRIPDRCLEETQVATRTAEPGEVVPVPQAGRDELVVMRVHGAEVGGLEKLGSLFWRPNERHASINGGEVRYKLVPSTTGDPMIVSADRSLDRKQDFAELPVIKNIAVEGAGGSLTYDFYRVKLRPVKLRVKGSAGGAESSVGEAGG